MIDHADCRRATVESPKPAERLWRCSKCRTPLARLDAQSTGGLQVLPPLRPLRQRHGDLPTFGLPQRQLAGGNDPHRTGVEVVPVRRLPVFVYCPRTGRFRCGIGQHLEG
jgi:hypothetical protein